MKTITFHKPTQETPVGLKITKETSEEDGSVRFLIKAVREDSLLSGNPDIRPGTRLYAVNGMLLEGCDTPKGVGQLLKLAVGDVTLQVGSSHKKKKKDNFREYTKQQENLLPSAELARSHKTKTRDHDKEHTILQCEQFLATEAFEQPFTNEISELTPHSSDFTPKVANISSKKKSHQSHREKYELPVRVPSEGNSLAVHKAPEIAPRAAMDIEAQMLQTHVEMSKNKEHANEQSRARWVAVAIAGAVAFVVIIALAVGGFILASSIDYQPSRDSYHVSIDWMLNGVGTPGPPYTMLWSNEYDPSVLRVGESTTVQNGSKTIRLLSVRDDQVHLLVSVTEACCTSIFNEVMTTLDGSWGEWSEEESCSCDLSSNFDHKVRAQVHKVVSADMQKT